ENDSVPPLPVRRPPFAFPFATFKPMRTRGRHRRYIIFLALAACAVIVPESISATTTDSDAGKKTSDSKSAAKKLHLSPQATEGPKPAPITPPKPEEITSAIHRGIKFLLADQRPD